MKISVKAFAKINLFLDMVSKRTDGYHNILSLMQSVSLYDTVTVEVSASSNSGITLSCNVESIPCDCSNLTYRAAQKYPRELGNISIHIEKRIPVSAGLAGGSADAAAVLFALNELSDAPLSLDELKAIGATLGADVPFCIECGSLLTKGIGEVTSPFPVMPEYPIVIAKMGDGMSTPMAYKKLDEMYSDFVGYEPHADELAILESTDASIENYCRGIFNIFEQAVEPQRPAVTAIKKIMTENGAVNATMSGSGTSVFGIFKDPDCAKRACELLLGMGAESYVCYPCTSHDRVIART